MITVIGNDMQTTITYDIEIDLARLERPTHCRRHAPKNDGAAAPLDTQPEQD